jgi:hypothetical protein
MGNKPLKERLKQDIAILLVVLLFAGGSLSVLAASPLFAPAMALFIILTFGPYAIEFASKSREAKKLGEKIIIKGTNLDGKGMKISNEWR